MKQLATLFLLLTVTESSINAHEALGRNSRGVGSTLTRRWVETHEAFVVLPSKVVISLPKVVFQKRAFLFHFVLQLAYSSGFQR